MPSSRSSSSVIASSAKPASAQRRHHRPRRPRQDHPGGRPVAAERHVPQQRAHRRAGHGQHRPRARARHHDPGQEHRGPLRRHPDQHLRHAGPRRLRRRSRADPVDGRRGHAARRRVGGAAAPDAVRAPQGARAPAAADGRDQQDRPARRARPGSAERDLRPLHRSRRHRRPARLPGHLRQRQGRHRVDVDGAARRGLPAALRRDHRARPGAARQGGRPAADSRRQSRFERLPRPDRRGTRVQRHRQDQRPGHGVQAGRLVQGHQDHQALRVRRPQARRSRSGRGRRHRLHRRARGHHHRRDDRRRRAPQGDAGHRHRRADRVDDLRRQHVADVGPRRPVRHLAPDQRSSRQRAARQRVDPRRADRHARSR